MAPHNPVPAEGTEPAPPLAPELPRLNEALFFWLVLFVFGGGLLALYYGEIGYFPEFSWEDSLTYLALMALTGGSLLGAFGFLLLAPGVMWSEYLIFDSYLHPSLTHAARKHRREPCLLSITRRIGVPFAVFMITGHALLALDVESKWVYLLLGVVVTLGVLSSHLWRRFEEDLKPSSINWTPLAEDPSILLSLRCRYLLVFNSAALISLTSVLFFYYQIHDGQVPPSLLVLCTVVVVLANIVVSMLFHRRRIQAFAVSFLAAMVLLVAGSFIGKEASLPRKIMAQFGFGEQRATLVVTEQEGEILGQLGLHVESMISSRSNELENREQQPLGAKAGPIEKTKNEEKRAIDAAVVHIIVENNPQGLAEEKRSDGLAMVHDVEILSRLGSHVLLRCGEQIISVPKDRILSWSAEEAPKVQESNRPLPCEKREEQPSAARSAETRLARQPS